MLLHDNFWVLWVFWLRTLATHNIWSLGKLKSKELRSDTATMACTGPGYAPNPDYPGPEAWLATLCTHFYASLLGKLNLSHANAPCLAASSCLISCGLHGTHLVPLRILSCVFSVKSPVSFWVLWVLVISHWVWGVLGNPDTPDQADNSS